MKDRVFLLVAMFLAAQSAAVADEWDWGVTPYLWAAGIDGGVSAGDIDVEGTSGQNGVFGDVAFLALEEDEAKDTVGGTLEVDLDTLIIEAGYRRSFSDVFALDIGARYWDFKTKLTPPVLPIARRSSAWTDGFVGARFANSLGDNWQWGTVCQFTRRQLAVGAANQHRCRRLGSRIGRGSRFPSRFIQWQQVYDRFPGSRHRI